MQRSMRAIKKPFEATSSTCGATLCRQHMKDALIYPPSNAPQKMRTGRSKHHKHKEIVRAWMPARIAAPGCSVAAAHKPLSVAMPSTALDAARNTICAGSMVILRRQHGHGIKHGGHKRTLTSNFAA